LEQHPTAEWWDMHGTSFERIYGRDRLNQVAGLIASTAPNRAPRENLQTMSEYMRRVIKGEPVLQPEWRVPEGEMSRLAGKQIGMEESFARNLQLSGEGRVAELGASKVNEEARALLGDPNAVVLDRHQVRLTESPRRGIFAGSDEGAFTNDKGYQLVKQQFLEAAKRAGRSARDYSADVWTGIRETIKNTSDLYGTKFRGSAIAGESKSYADHFDHLIRDKAKHLGITVAEMESRLSRGDATLMSWLVGTPIGATLYARWAESQPRAAGARASTP
jgi:hypothetical protein